MKGSLQWMDFHADARRLRVLVGQAVGLVVSLIVLPSVFSGCDIGDIRDREQAPWVATGGQTSRGLVLTRHLADRG